MSWLGAWREWCITAAGPNATSPGKLWRTFWWDSPIRDARYPPFVVIDPIVRCNLTCPLCSVDPRLLDRHGTKMSLDQFRNILEQVKSITNLLVFCHAGEPFLHPDLLKMVRLTHDAGMRTFVGSNGTCITDAIIDEVFASGLDTLQISFDGFSKESYEKYRVGADFDKVLAGITRLADEKRRRKARKPFLEVYSLVNAYNVHEIEDASRYFRNLGIHYVPKGINLNVHRRLDGKNAEDLEHWIETESCYALYTRMNGKLEYKVPFKPYCDTCEKPVITSRGDVLLCCHDIFNSVKIGNVLQDSLSELWFSKKYRSLRKLASNRQLPLCRVCGK